jgi:hypothetical protein
MYLTIAPGDGNTRNHLIVYGRQASNAREEAAAGSVVSWGRRATLGGGVSRLGAIPGDGIMNWCESPR